MQKILEDAKLDSNANYLYITSGDGFYETVPLDEIAADERIHGEDCMFLIWS